MKFPNQLATVSLAISLSACVVGTDSDSQELDLGAEASGVSPHALVDNSIKVMSFNVRVDANQDEDTIGSFSKRLPRILATIRHHDPDIIGLQEVEEKNWDKLDDALSGDYLRTFRQRGGGAINNGSEGVAIFARRSRFTWMESDENTFSGSERRQANDCPAQLIGAKGNRNVVRVKLTDNQTDNVIDVFNTHFPSEVDCEKIGMAKLLRAYVHAYGDNVLLMGDFNTGISKTGNPSEGFDVLTGVLDSDGSVDLEHQGYLSETYWQRYRPMTNGHSFITSGAADPRVRIGTKIDHIMVAPAFQVNSALIDRSLFRGSKHINCDDAHSKIDQNGKRTECKSGDTIYSVGKPPSGDLDVASDHWAIVSVVTRLPCKLEACAASRR